MISIATKINGLIDPLRWIAHKIGSPVFDLAARIYLAHFFWNSGMVRFNDWINGTFDNQLFLFELEHPVPGLDPSTAAHMTLAAELILPILVVFGLFTRFGAAGLFIMTLVIELTYIHTTEHVIWFILSAMIFIKGPGMISVDHFLVKYLRKEPSENNTSNGDKNLEDAQSQAA